MLSDASEQKYIDEYMEVGKRDEETGMLTRFITSNDEMFGLEVTMKKGFNHGYYDGVMIALYDVHSGNMFWEKRYPKSCEKEPRQKDESILIDSIHCATVDGQVRSNVRMKLAPLIPAEDFLKQGADPTRKYPRMLEGLRIEVCKYKKTGDLEFTKDELTGGIAVPNEEIENYLVPPTQYDKRFKYGNTQNFYYLWRGEKFFDTMAIAQTPIASIRQPWDLLSPKERETAYTELSRYDFQQIWSHHCTNLGPRPKKAAVRALKDELLKNLPEYWRSWGKLYTREKPTAFRKLQERRRYLDKGEIPEDTELIGKSEEAAIDLENEPQRLEKPSESIRVPSFTNRCAGLSNGAGQAITKPVVLSVNTPDTNPQAQPDRTIGCTNLATIKPAQVQETAALTSTSTRPPRTTDTWSTANNMLDTPHVLDTVAQVGSNVLQSFFPKFPEGVSRCVTKEAPIKPCYNNLSSTGAVPPSGIEPELISRVAKRPSEFMDLSRPKRLSQSMKSSIEYGHIFGKSSLEMRPMNSSMSTLAKVKSDPSISEAHFLEDHMDIGVPRNVMPTSSSTFKSPLTDSTNIRTEHKPSSKVTALSTVKVELEKPQVDINSTATEPVQMIGMLPDILNVKPEDLSMDVIIPFTPPSLGSLEAFKTSISSKIKYEESKIISKPTTEAIETRLEPTANPSLNSKIPFKSKKSSSPTINIESTCTKVSEAPSIPVIDLETWVPSLAFTTTYLSTTSSAPIFKPEVDLDRKSSLNLNGDLEGLEAELKTLEEEARRKEVEFEDAMRVAEARKEMNGARRRIEQLRLGVLGIGGN
ncbi:hypothetical protein EYC84_011692 [Monilinia fructicola]|uniref:Uncharacterized protein n=1 Tax=Monilinia fructicola TaxID=38448 RepID=A0A5M9J4C7_MONFR|nr:hypothetical protein EYC84_011692 [Monilinia fructicola]